MAAARGPAPGDDLHADDAPVAKIEAKRSDGPATGTVETNASPPRRLTPRRGRYARPRLRRRAVIAGQGTIGLELAEQAPDADTVLTRSAAAGSPPASPRAPRAPPDSAPSGRLPAGPHDRRRDLREAPGALPARSSSGRWTTPSGCRTRRSPRRSCCAWSARSSSGGRRRRRPRRPSRRRESGSGPVAIVLSGGNIDATTLISVLRHGLTEAGRYLAIRLLIPDRPGELRSVLDFVARERGNIVSVDHHREGRRRARSRPRSSSSSPCVTRPTARRSSSVPRRTYTLERLGPPRLSSDIHGIAASCLWVHVVCQSSSFTPQPMSAWGTVLQVSDYPNVLAASAAAAAKLDGGRPSRPAVDAAVHHRVRVESACSEDARCDRGPRACLADRHDRSVTGKVGLPERKQAIGDVAAAGDVPGRVRPSP